MRDFLLSAKRMKGYLEVCNVLQKMRCGTAWRQRILPEMRHTGERRARRHWRKQQRPADSWRKRFSLLSVRGWFSVQGRMARQELWIRVLILLGIGYILNYFAMQLPDDTESYSGAQTAFMFAALAVCIVLAVSCYCIYVRRLHDINSSGYVVIPIIIIDLSVLVVDIIVTDDSSFFGFEDLVNVIELVILGSIRGTEGQNRFGPDPKARRSGRG